MKFVDENEKSRKKHKNLGRVLQKSIRRERWKIRNKRKVKSEGRRKHEIDHNRNNQI